MDAARPQEPGRKAARHVDAVAPPRTGGLSATGSGPSGWSEEAAASGPADLVPLDPRVRMLWWVTGAAQVLVAGLLVAPVDFLTTLPMPNGALTLLAVAVLGVIHAVVPVLRFRRWRYAMRERDLWIRRGVLWVTISVIPFARIQFVDTRQGPLDRLFGLSQLVVHTAALGTSGRLPGLDADEAERLRERLAEVEPDEAASV